MSDAALEFVPYALQYTREAIDMRKRLPVEQQGSLMEVIDQLLEDPRRHPYRLRPLSQDGKTVVYMHPEPALELTVLIDDDRQVICILHVAMSLIRRRTKVFISYSHQDKESLAELHKWLTTLEREDVLKAWDDTEIRAGDLWRKKIQKSLEEAEVAILLVSQDFISSDFIAENELPPLLEAADQKGVRILWIALSPSAVMDTPLEKFQALNTDPGRPLNLLDAGERSLEWQHIYTQIRDVISDGTTGGPMSLQA